MNQTKELFKKELSKELKPFNEAYFRGYVDCVFDKDAEVDFLKIYLPIGRHVIGDLDYETELRQITSEYIMELITEQINKDYEKRVVLAKLHSEPEDLNDLEAMMMVYDANEVIKRIKEKLSG